MFAHWQVLLSALENAMCSTSLPASSSGFQKSMKRCVLTSAVVTTLPARMRSNTANADSCDISSCRGSPPSSEYSIRMTGTPSAERRAAGRSTVDSVVMIYGSISYPL